MMSNQGLFSLLVSKDFNASVRLDMLLNGILNWLLTKSFSFYKSQFSALEDVSRDVLKALTNIPDKKRNAYSDIFLFSLPFLVQVVLLIKSLRIIGL